MKYAIIDSLPTTRVFNFGYSKEEAEDVLNFLNGNFSVTLLEPRFKIATEDEAIIIDLIR